MTKLSKSQVTTACFEAIQTDVQESICCRCAMTGKSLSASEICHLPGGSLGRACTSTTKIKDVMQGPRFD